MADLQIIFRLLGLERFSRLLQEKDLVMQVDFAEERIGMRTKAAHDFQSSLRRRNRKSGVFSRLALLAGLVAATLGLILCQAAAQDWPQRPIMLILPYPPGGTIDFQARIMERALVRKARPARRRSK